MKNPRNPSFEGLEVYARHLPGVSQPLRTAEFNKFVTDAQKTDAFVMKQDRLMREETAAVQRQSPPAPAAPTGEPAPKRQRRPKAKAGADG